jgi:hypothetical protein
MATSKMMRIAMRSAQNCTRSRAFVQGANAFWSAHTGQQSVRNPFLGMKNRARFLAGYFNARNEIRGF